MKPTLSFAAAFLLSAALTACTGSTQSTEERTETPIPEYSEDNRDVLLTLGKLHYTDSVRAGGHLYAYTIDRSPLDSVIIVDEDGYRSQDNTVSLSIQRDGAEFFQRTFTRAAFHIRVPDDYYQQCILLGLNFDRVTDYGLRFIASIGMGSDNENYKPYALTVGLDGNTNITEHDLYDDDDLARFEDEDV